jgi:hypothetical protein
VIFHAHLSVRNFMVSIPLLSENVQDADTPPNIPLDASVPLDAVNLGRASTPGLAGGFTGDPSLRAYKHAYNVATCADTHDQNRLQLRSAATVSAWLPQRCQASLPPSDCRPMQPRVQQVDHQSMRPFSLLAGVRLDAGGKINS